MLLTAALEAVCRQVETLWEVCNSSRMSAHPRCRASCRHGLTRTRLPCRLGRSEMKWERVDTGNGELIGTESGGVGTFPRKVCWILPESRLFLAGCTAASKFRSTLRV